VKTIKLVVLTLCLTISNAWAAGDWWGDLQGEVGIGQSPLVDPNPDDPSAAYIVIKGEAAKRIYERMKSAEIHKGKFVCEVGTVTKVTGDLQCTMYGKGVSYECDIGINLESGKSAVGRSC
jgi:hypothetical protein